MIYEIPIYVSMYVIIYILNIYQAFESWINRDTVIFEDDRGDVV